MARLVMKWIYPDEQSARREEMLFILDRHALEKASDIIRKYDERDQDDRSPLPTLQDLKIERNDGATLNFEQLRRRMKSPA